MSVQLAVTSYYSLFQSSLSINDIISLCKENGNKAVALCDHNVMYGSIAFYRACLKNDIKPIIGLACDIEINGIKSMLFVYARNNNGYKKIVQLSTILNTEKEVLSLDDFSQNEDLIIIIPTFNSLLDSSIINSNLVNLEDDLLKYKKFFKHLYVGLANQDEAFYKTKNNEVKNICQKVDVKTCAFLLTKSRTKNDISLIKALKALYYKTNIYDSAVNEEKYSYYHSGEELLKLYSQDDILETDNIANDCNVNIDQEKASLLVYPNNKNKDSKTYLADLCKMGLYKRFNMNVPKVEYQKRLEYELNIINKMGYDDYFLIVYDFIKYARDNNIYVGPGRGSAAGSIVAYCLGITHIDPIKYGLLFERFLNPERISMPDIDVDFPDDKRLDVINHVSEKYGKDKVAHIIAFSTLLSRAAIDAACEALRVDKRKLEYIKKYLPKVTLDKNSDVLISEYKNNSKVREIVESDDDIKDVYNLAIQLEKMPKNITTHACGIVMSNKPLTETIALCKVNGETLSTQISADYLEDLGLLKMDFLGIRNLSIIDRVCSRINPKLDILKIPENDQKTYDLIKNGNVVGLFQLESEGMKALVNRLKPTSLSEISDTIALYRPGAMDNIDDYLLNRKNPEKINYLHKNLEPVLKSTYGMVIYQEQVMQIAQIMAGFSLAKADLLRRAMSKKKEKELLALKDDFINGCLNNNYDLELANKLYELILKFAGYGFNKSHSCAYSLVAYQMAYLKAHYPNEFLCELLNNVIGSATKTYEYLNEAKKLKVNVLPLSVNYSNDIYNIENDGIRIPLRIIKNVGSSVVNEIINERIDKGLFIDYFDFIARINMRKISKSTIECLINAGALDEFKISRASMLESLNDALQYAELVKVDNPTQTYLDFDLVYKPSLTICKEDQIMKLNNEVEVLGFYLSKHPIELIKEKLDYHGLSLINIKEGSNVKTIVRITRVKNHMAKTGNMAFITVDDNTSSIDAVLLPNSYEQYNNLCNVGSIVEIYGKVDMRNERLSIVINRINEINV